MIFSLEHPRGALRGIKPYIVIRGIERKKISRIEVIFQ